MITKGNTTLQYGDGNHVNAVTAANSQAGVINYSYDSAGNMVSRNGDAMSYDSFGRLNQIQTSDGKNIVYTYTNGGDRIKKELPNNVVVYSFGGRYQVTRQPGQPDLHTVYVKGLKGDLVAQMTRNDAVLITSLDIKQPVLASNHPQPLLVKEWRLAVKRVKATFAYFVNTAVKQNPYQIRLYAIYGSLAM
ncbi:MAG: hypothetical protein K8R21_03670, partial [Leptospira sp.]|nr:hypothetical protein [Leptospira sp.]